MKNWKNIGKRSLSAFLALVMCLGMVCTTAFAEGEGEGAGTVVCTKTEDCTAETHEADCPKYVAPEEPKVCETCGQDPCVCEEEEEQDGDGDTAALDEFNAAVDAMGDATDMESTLAALNAIETAYAALSDDEKASVAEQWAYIQDYAEQVRAGNPDEGVDTLEEETEPQAEQTEAQKLQAAINAAEEGVKTTITMTADITDMTTDEIITIPEGKVIVLDMQGHSITVAGPKNNQESGVEVKSGEDSSAIENLSFKGRPIVNNGTLTITGNGTISSNNSGYVRTYKVDNKEQKVFVNSVGGYGAIRNDGTLTIENGTYAGNGYTYGSCIRNGKGATLTVNGGTFSANQAIYNGGEATITAGEFITTACSNKECTWGAYGYAINNNSEDGNSNVKMLIDPKTDEDVKVHGAQGALAAAAGTDVRVLGGTFYTEPCEKKHTYSVFYALYVSGKAGQPATCVVEGGKFSTTGAYACIYVNNTNTVDNGGNPGQGILEIKGGSFTQGDSTNNLIVFTNANNSVLNITGGSFSGSKIDQVNSYVDPSCVFDKGTGKVEPLTEETGVAEVGGKYYSTLQAAIDAATDGDTVTLLESVDLTNLPGGYNVFDISGMVLDLDGKTITVANDNSKKKDEPGGYLVFQGKNAKITNGTFAVTDGNYSLMIGDEGETDNLVVENVTATGVNIYNATNVTLRDVDSAAKRYYAVWCDENAHVKIESGNYSTTDVSTALLGLVSAENEAEMKIEGGSFNSGNKPMVLEEETKFGAPEISGGTFSSDVKAYVVEGAQTNESNGVWTIGPATGEDYVAQVGNVAYKTLQAAIDAAQSGDTVTLLRNTAESVTVAANQNITLDLNGMTLSGMMEARKAHTSANDNATYHAMKNVITNQGTLTIMDSKWRGVDADGNVIGEDPVGTIMGGTDGDTKYISWYKDGQPQYAYPGRSGIAIVNEENATCTIKSGLIKRGDNGTFGNYTVQNKGHMIVEDGLITNNSNVSNLVVNFTKKKNAENKDSYINGCKAVMDITGGMLHQNNMSVLKNDPGGELNISGDAALVWRVANENNYATNFYGTVNMTGGTIRTNGVIPLFSWKEGDTEFPAEFNISGNAHLECNALESNNGVMGGYNDAYVTHSTVPTINISGNPTITVNKLQTVCSINNQMTAVANRTQATINVSGGTFNHEVPAGYCAAGFLPIANSDGTYGVSNGNLVLTPSVTSMTGSGTITLRTTFAGSAVNATVTGNNNVTVTGSNGAYTVSLPNTTATYTFTATFGGKTATCTVTVTRYTYSGGGSSSGGGYRPSGGGSSSGGGGTVNIQDPDVPLADLPLVFTDVASDAYYVDAVKWAVQEKITSGTSSTTFSPNATCTRAQMVTFLWRAAGSPAPKSGTNPFTDVVSGAYYYDAVLWAVEQGITSGTSKTMFSPDAKVTRGQSVTFLYRAAGSPAVNDGKSFDDVDSSAFYAKAVQWAAEKGVTSGTTKTTFSPGNNCTRAQIVSFLYRDRVS